MRRAKTIRIFLFTLFIWIITNCSTEKKDILNIEVNIDKMDKVSFFDIFSNATIIPLETNDSSLIKEITKVIPCNDKFYVLDYANAEILFFNKDGRFLNKISDQGMGPNQYINISDFDIDQSKNILTCLSSPENTMYEYDLSGNFLKKYKLPSIKGAYNRLKHLTSDTIAYWTFDYDNRIKFYSKDKNIIINEAFPEVENIVNNFAPFVFSCGHYLCRSASNTIYAITNNAEIIAKYKWDFIGINNSKRQIEKLEEIPSNEIRSFLSKILNSEIINYVQSLQGATTQYYYSQIWRKGERVNIFHDKVNNNNYVFKQFIEGSQFYPFFWQEDYVIGVYSEDLGNIEEIIPDTILNEKDIKKKEKIGENDNPILIKYNFK